MLSLLVLFVHDIFWMANATLFLYVSIIGLASFDLLGNTQCLCFTAPVIWVRSINTCGIDVLIVIALQAELLLIGFKLIPKDSRAFQRYVVLGSSRWLPRLQIPFPDAEIASDVRIRTKPCRRA